MNQNGKTITVEPTTRFTTDYPAVPLSCWELILNLTMAAVSIILIAIIAFLLLPEQRQLIGKLQEIESNLLKEEKAREDSQKNLTLSRKIVIQQQAELAKHMESIKRLTEENLQLAEKLNKRLKGEKNGM